ncbi:MAG: NUDIX hydrolase [Pseudomonadota bacterium]
MVFARPLQSCRLRLTDGSWPFAADRADAIAAHWQDALALTPEMWDGRVLLSNSWTFQDGILEGSLIDVAYSAYHAWKSWDFPDPSVANCFGSGLIRSSDGALIYGVMAGTTSNAGRIYPVAGMLDQSDVAPDGTIDIFASVGRELTEETGLTIAECRRGDRFMLTNGPLISIAEVLTFDEDAERLAARIRASIASEAEPELEDVVILRQAADLDRGRSFDFAHSIAAHLLDGVPLPG